MICNDKHIICNDMFIQQMVYIYIYGESTHRSRLLRRSSTGSVADRPSSLVTRRYIVMVPSIEKTHIGLECWYNYM